VSKRPERPTDELRPPTLPQGPPLHLERPGRCAELLRPHLTEERFARMEQVLAHRTRYLAALIEHVHDPHNIAACVRSCDAAGVQDLHVVAADGGFLRVGRAVSMGAHRWLTVHYHPTVEAAVAALRARGYRIVATDLGGPRPPTPLPEVPLDAPLCVAFGNERDGISATLREAADVRVIIPMRGFVESLNISVAFAVSLFTARMRLEASGGPPPLAEGERLALLDRWALENVRRAPGILERLAADAADP